MLESERYIRRINRLYIKLDDKGTRLVKEFGYDYSYKCRRKEYVDRLNEIVELPDSVTNELLVKDDEDTQLQKAIELLK